MEEPDSLPPEVQTILDAWEQGPGAAAPMRDDPAAQKIHAAFLAHPDMRALAALTEAAHRDDAEETYAIPAARGLIHLLEHIERLDAAAAGRSPAATPALLARIIDNYLQALLHSLATDPTAHPHYARLWNQLCSEAGQPALAIPDKRPQVAGPQSRPTKDGPF